VRYLPRVRKVCELVREFKEEAHWRLDEGSLRNFCDADGLFEDNGQRATKYIAEIPVIRYKTFTAHLK